MKQENSLEVSREDLIKSEEYTHKPRTIHEIHEHGHGFYKRIIKEHGGIPDSFREAYIGWENCSKDSSPEELSKKQPNVTYLWNIPFNGTGFLYGSTLGHKHPSLDFLVQEIYEFFGFGGMLISRGKSTQLYICKKGDKLAVPTDCTMTILNLSREPLLTLDMANPRENPSSKDYLKEMNGPMLALCHLGNSKSYKYNVDEVKPCRLVPMEGTVRMHLNLNYPSFGISSDQLSFVDFKIGEGNESLYQELINQESKEKLAKFNIEILSASSDITIQGRDGSYHLNKPLLSLIYSDDKPLHKALKLI